MNYDFGATLLDMLAVYRDACEPRDGYFELYHAIDDIRHGVDLTPAIVKLWGEVEDDLIEAGVCPKCEGQICDSVAYGPGRVEITRVCIDCSQDYGTQIYRK